MGPAEATSGPVVFRLSPSEVLSSATLDAQLDALQTVAGVEEIIVVTDFAYAAEFLRGCRPPDGKRRVLIAGTRSGNTILLERPFLTSFSFEFISAAHLGRNLYVTHSAQLEIWWLRSVGGNRLLG